MYTGKSRFHKVLYALELFKSSSDEEPELSVLCYASIQECGGGEERIHSWEKALQVKICSNQKQALTFLYHTLRVYSMPRIAGEQRTNCAHAEEISKQYA